MRIQRNAIKPLVCCALSLNRVCLQGAGTDATDTHTHVHTQEVGQGPTWL